MGRCRLTLVLCAAALCGLGCSSNKGATTQREAPALSAATPVAVSGEVLSTKTVPASTALPSKDAGVRRRTEALLAGFGVPANKATALLDRLLREKAPDFDALAASVIADRTTAQKVAGIL